MLCCTKGHFITIRVALNDNSALRHAKDYISEQYRTGATSVDQLVQLGGGAAFC